MAGKDNPKPKKETKGFIDGGQLVSKIPASTPTTSTTPPPNIPATKPKPKAPSAIAGTPLEKKIQQAREELSRYQLVGGTATGKYTIDGKEVNYYSWAEARNKVKTKLDKLLSAPGGVENANRLISSLEEKNDGLLAALAKGSIKDDSAVELTNKTIAANNARITELKSIVEQKIETPEQELITSKTVTDEATASAADFRKAEGFAPGTFTKPGTPAKPGAPIVVGSARIKNGVTQTWNGSKWTSEKGTTAKAVDWESKFREMFPGETWMLDIDRTKYPDVFALFQKSITDEVYKTPEGIARFKAQLQGTTFVKELATTDMVRQVKAVVGDLGFDSAPLSSFLTKAMNMGWKDATLKAEVYKEAFRKDDSGAYVNPTAITRAKASNDYLSIAKIGKDYFNMVSDDTIQNVLTGGMTQEDVQRQQRELAKTKYGHLSNLIDQGLSLAEVSSSFKQQAAGLLERDPNSIDMSQADFEEAFNFGEEGKKRVMTTGEWEIKLRSDPRYNWDKTTNAKQEARTLANSIASAFGRVI